MSDGTKKLHRSKDDRWLAGVCGGIAEYFDVDGTLIRVLFILFGFAVGGGLLIYIILWIIMPEAADDVLNDGSVEELKSEEADVANSGLEADNGEAVSSESDTDA
jgi:phage shock protein PspC (stress-responsive transcriptional regulator)